MNLDGETESKKRVLKNSDVDPAFGTPEQASSDIKNQKLESSGTIIEPFPNTRKVMMKFVSVDVEIPGIIVCKEHWGLLVKVSSVPDTSLGILVGEKYWTKWCGAYSPLILLPIVEVVHKWKN